MNIGVITNNDTLSVDQCGPDKTHPSAASILRERPAAAWRLAYNSHIHHELKILACLQQASAFPLSVEAQAPPSSGGPCVSFTGSTWRSSASHGTDHAMALSLQRARWTHSTAASKPTRSTMTSRGRNAGRRPRKCASTSLPLVWSVANAPDRCLSK